MDSNFTSIAKATYHEENELKMEEERDLLMQEEESKNQENVDEENPPSTTTTSRKTTKDIFGQLKLIDDYEFFIKTIGKRPPLLMLEFAFDILERKIDKLCNFLISSSS